MIVVEKNEEQKSANLINKKIVCGKEDCEFAILPMKLWNERMWIRLRKSRRENYTLQSRTNFNCICILLFHIV